MTSPWPLTQTVFPLTVWQLTPLEPAQLRLPFTDWQRKVSADAETPHQTIEKPANMTVREQRDMVASSAAGLVDETLIGRGQRAVTQVVATGVGVRCQDTARALCVDRLAGGGAATQRQVGTDGHLRAHQRPALG